MSTEQIKPEREAIICTCKQSGELAAEARRLEAQRLLAVADPSRLAETLIMSMAFDFGAVVDVYSDQWFYLQVEAADGYEDDVEADHPLDGMIELWFRLRERFPDKLSREPARSTQTEVWSERQVKHLQLVDAELAVHDVECETCLRRPGDPERTPKRCGTGQVLWLEGIHQRKSLMGKWGVSTMKESPLFWGER